MIEIKSLKIKCSGSIIVTDVDDCLIQTTIALKALGVNKRDFFFNPDIFEKYKDDIYTPSKLTDWGNELRYMLENKMIGKLTILTSAQGHGDTLGYMFPLAHLILMGVNDEDKETFLNRIKGNALYVDDKQNLFNRLNGNITCVKYPIFGSKFHVRRKPKFKKRM